MTEVDSNKSCTVSFLGPPGVGKTSLIERITQNQFTLHRSDVGVNSSNINIQIGTPPITVKVLIQDTPGQQTFFEYTANFIHNSSAVILVYDISEPTTIDELKFYINKVQNEKLLPIFIIGNKSDLDPNGQNQNEITSKLLQYTNDPNIFTNFPQVSARTGNNVVNVFNSIVAQALEFVPQQNGTQLTVNQSNSKNCC